MQLAEKMRVMVNSPFGIGPGTIEHISIFWCCPVQVELDEPNADGHKLIRFEFAEVKPIEHLQPIECLWPEEVEPTEKEVHLSNEPMEEIQADVSEISKPIVELPNEPEPLKNIIIQLLDKIPGYSYKPGEIFLARENGNCFYLYEPETLTARGCMQQKHFKILRTLADGETFNDYKATFKPLQTFLEKSNIIVTDEPKTPPKAVKKPKTLFEALEQKGQSNIFDFI
ncbi:hypothetical protein CPT_Silence30 [Bacillus phage Silence]|nr:hypothetical protein CPT_Silence30 [Bacillus phage Silence]